jgi:hypothetical protein
MTGAHDIAQIPVEWICQGHSDDLAAEEDMRCPAGWAALTIVALSVLLWGAILAPLSLI